MPLAKKIFFVSLAVFCLSGLFFAIYSFSFKKTTGKPEQESPQKQTQGEPTNPPKSSSEPITPISDEAVISPVFSKEKGKIRYYSALSGQPFETDLQGNDKKPLSEKTVSGLKRAAWSPDKTKSIINFDNGTETGFYFSDHTQGKLVPLKKNIDEVTWQTSGNKIFYKYYDPATKKRSLNIADPDGNNWTKVSDIDFRDVSIAQIPQSGLVSFWNKPDAFFETSFKSISLVGENEKKITGGLFGADYLWSGNGEYVLVSHTDTKGGSKTHLAIMNARGGEFRNLNLPTLVSKCVWLKNNKNVLCALPGEIPQNSIMPNDYQVGKFRTADTFWNINTETGEKTRAIELEKIDAKYDATELFFNADESVLFFKNRLDEKLYRLLL